MSENKDQCRAEFEVWAQNNGYNTSPHPTNGQYWDSHVDTRWDIWKAAWNRRATAPVAEPVTLSDLQIDEIAWEFQCGGEHSKWIFNKDDFKLMVAAILAASQGS